MVVVGAGRRGAAGVVGVKRGDRKDTKHAQSAAHPAAQKGLYTKAHCRAGDTS